MLYSTLIDNLQSAPDSGHRYDAISIALHWATLLLLIAMYWTAHAHEAAADGAVAARMLLLHRSTGLLVWFVTVARLGWKGMFGVAPALPTAMKPAQRFVARSMQTMLYALLLLMPVTGLLQSVLRGKAFPLILGEFPAVVARDKVAVTLFHGIHETSATTLLVLIGLHALAGICHGLLRRDGVLGSMLRVFGSKARREEVA